MLQPEKPITLHDQCVITTVGFQRKCPGQTARSHTIAPVNLHSSAPLSQPTNIHCLQVTLQSYRWLPPTPAHPGAVGPMRAKPCPAVPSLLLGFCVHHYHCLPRASCGLIMPPSDCSSLRTGRVYLKLRLPENRLTSFAVPTAVWASLAS